MNTIYDWATVALFCVVAVLYLQRSVGPARPGDRVIAYLPPAVGCAVANWLGNEGHDGWAVLSMLAVALYILIVLRPGQVSR